MEKDGQDENSLSDPTVGADGTRSDAGDAPGLGFNKVIRSALLSAPVAATHAVEVIVATNPHRSSHC
jgi:hypothetical protein